MKASEVALKIQELTKKVQELPTPSEGDFYDWSQCMLSAEALSSAASVIEDRIFRLRTDADDKGYK